MITYFYIHIATVIFCLKIFSYDHSIIGLCDNGNSLNMIIQPSVTIITDNDIHLQSIPKYYNIQLYELEIFSIRDVISHA